MSDAFLSFVSSPLFVLVLIWAGVWKAFALWMSARRNHKIWFAILLVVNTVGVLEILYIFIFSKLGKQQKKTFTAEEAKIIGEKLGLKWDKWDVEQFRMGMDVELEHGKADANTNVTNDDALLTGKIALAHLNEIRDYYTRLSKMEQEGEAYWDNQNK